MQVDIPPALEVPVIYVIIDGNESKRKPLRDSRFWSMFPFTDRLLGTRYFCPIAKSIFQDSFATKDDFQQKLEAAGRAMNWAMSAESSTTITFAVFQTENP